MSKIHSLHGRIINDSRGDPTIEVELQTENGKVVNASVPNGISRGTEEALPIAPEEAVRKIETDIAPQIVGKEIVQKDLDAFLLSLDGTEKKGNLGANTMLGVSLAIAKAGAASEDIPLFKYIGNIFDGGNSIALPIPMFNLINGGAHASNNLEFQEFMAVPSGFGSFRERFEVGTKIFETLKKVLQEKGLKTDDGDEGGYAPDLDTNEMALGLMIEAINQAGYKAGRDVFLALDVAASYLPPTFQLNIERFVNLSGMFPIVSLEDPLGEDDWERWAQLKLELEHTNKTGRPIYLVGDDLFVTHIDRLKKGINQYVANGILIKINQVAVLSEILEIIKLAKANDYIHIISHRAGETMDSLIADLAVGTGATYMKAGAPNVNHPERISKYERLIKIEKELMIA